MRSIWAEAATRPVLLWEAARAAWAFRSRRGLLPSRALIRWRLATAYGSADASPRPEDVRAFLMWRRLVRQSVGRVG